MKKKNSMFVWYGAQSNSIYNYSDHDLTAACVSPCYIIVTSEKVRSAHVSELLSYSKYNYYVEFT